MILAIAGSFLLMLCWITFSLMLLAHRQKMATRPGDRAQDPIVRNPLFIPISLGFLSLLYLAASVRRIALFFGQWSLSENPEGGLPNLLAPLRHFLDHAPLGFQLPLGYKAFALGAFLFWGGVILRMFAIRTLGRFFTFQIGIRRDHHIVRDGPYRWLRHPSYTGLLLMQLGLSLMVASLTLTLWCVGGMTVFLALRIRQEEKMLARAFGREFEAYRSETWALVPFFF